MAVKGGRDSDAAVGSYAPGAISNRAEARRNCAVDGKECSYPIKKKTYVTFNCSALLAGQQKGAPVYWSHEAKYMRAVAE